MNYYELVCTSASPEHSEILIVQLGELGFESFVDTENGFNAYIQEELYTSEVKKEIVQLNSLIQFNSKVQFIADQNWNEKWEKNFEPINVKDICYIRASFHPRVTSIKYDIIINPKMSFGTGHHETTRLVISQMLELDWKGKVVCDMGCGTSILAILAEMMGAASVLAVDTDEWAVENSLENIDTNNMQGVVVKKGDAQLLAGKTFHVILANINRNILLNDMGRYAQSLDKQGFLIVSGFFDIDAPLIISSAESVGMRILNRMAQNKWTMLCFSKDK